LICYKRIPRDRSGGVTIKRCLSAYYLDIFLEITESRQINKSQQLAVKNYRIRLSERGLARFEVLGCESDRNLIRLLAKCLAEGGAEASKLRKIVNDAITGESSKKGGILNALRRSSIVGIDLDIARQREEGRKVDL
jgi:hypothetical protein